jgi:hypothetical protein
MLPKFRWVAIPALALAAQIAPALAAETTTDAPCGPRDAVVEQLGQTFDEAPAGRGVMLEGAMLELFVSPKGSWTVLITNPDKTSCLATAGEAWQGAEGEKGSSTQLRGSAGAAGDKRRLIDVLLQR